jgi:hypothetical protein
LFEAVLRDRLKLRVKMQRHEDRGVRLLFIDLTPLRLNFDPATPIFLFPAHLGIVAEDTLGIVRDLRIRHRLTARTCFVAIDAPMSTSALLPLLREERLVLLARAELAEITTAGSASEALLRTIRGQLPRTLLSPYETTLPVTGSRFYGREAELRNILTRPEVSFGLSGMRRIGKTSLLHEIRRRVEDAEDPDSGADILDMRAPILFIDCSTYRDEQILTTIVDRLNPRQTRRFQQRRYPEVLREVTNRGRKRLHILLDEIDQLVEADRAKDWEVLHMLRSSAQEGYARYIFAGQRRMLAQLTDRDSPFFNFARPVELGAFSQTVARDLVRTPLTQLGIRIPEPILDRVVHETGGHPNLLQMYCQVFIEKLDEEGRDSVVEEDLSSVYTNTNFNTVVMGAFHLDTTVLEKLVVYLCLRSKSKLPSGEAAVGKLETFDLGMVDAMTAEIGFVLHDSALQQALQNLRSSGILAPVAGGYRFHIPILAELLTEKYDLDYLVNHLRLEHPNAIIAQPR